MLSKQWRWCPKIEAEEHEMEQPLNQNIAELRKQDNTGDKENGKVLADIEKFIYECENMSRVPNPHIRRIYDDVDLLSVLDSDSGKIKENNTSNPIKCKVNPSSIPPKKRKLNENPEEPKRKMIRLIKALPMKKRDESKSGRVKAKKMNKAEIKEISEIKFVTCKELVHPKKRKIRRPSSCHSFHQATVNVTKTECVQIWKNLNIKKELVDLTGEEDIFCTYLKFAKISTIDAAEVFEIKRVTANVSVETDYQCKVTVSVPQVQFHMQGPHVDLTASSNVQNTIVTSEKDCAGRIVQTIYNYHKIYEANQKMEHALQEIEECLSPEDVNEDYELTFSLLTKHTDALGYTINQILSEISVKNLNLIRFLDILVMKLGLQYKVSITPKTVCFYLFSMLNQNEDENNKLSTELLKQIRNYIKTDGIKEERQQSTQQEGFTNEQLDQLFWQIEKYNELAIRQEQLMAVYNEQLEELGLSGKFYVQEEQDLKIENGIICILDD